MEVENIIIETFRKFSMDHLNLKFTPHKKA